MTSFSSSDRDRSLENSGNEVFDLLVIGGGITGAGILLDAQSRGLKAALVEMQDFASGTSSRSTKLIHGGLRYLKNLEFKLVAEVGRERAIVYENGPHITKAEPMLLPIVKGGSLNKFTAGMGVWAYDILAGVKKHEHRKLLSAGNTISAEPLMNRAIVTGGVLYYEYRTDDARLTIEVIKKAVELGAVAVNYTKAESFAYQNGKITGAHVRNLINDKTYELKAKVVVNATGPWVDKLLEQDEPKKAGRLFITKGVHLVVDYGRLPVRQSAYFDTGDGRMIFVIPREGKTYIGTTDTPYTQDYVNPSITSQDIEYLLTAVNNIFPTVFLKKEDVVSGWSGLRPLIREEGKSASEISRKDEIFINASGLISIAGGKLTGYRRMAEKIVDLVARNLKEHYHQKVRPCITKSLKLSGGEVSGSKNFYAYVNELTAKGLLSGLSEADARYIALHYGSNAEAIYQLAAGKAEESAGAGLPLRVYAQLLYALEYESVIAPADFLIRRGGFLYFYPQEFNAWKEAVTAVVKTKNNWSAGMEAKFREDLDLQAKIATGSI